eukprot:1189022-Prorocentrum_minimum.AAC.1
MPHMLDRSRGVVRHLVLVRRRRGRGGIHDAHRPKARVPSERHACERGNIPEISQPERANVGIFQKSANQSLLLLLLLTPVVGRRLLLESAHGDTPHPHVQLSTSEYY